jgi:hypothetical protein
MMEDTAVATVMSTEGVGMTAAFATTMITAAVATTMSEAGVCISHMSTRNGFMSNRRSTMNRHHRRASVSFYRA